MRGDLPAPGASGPVEITRFLLALCLELQASIIFFTLGPFGSQPLSLAISCKRSTS